MSHKNNVPKIRIPRGRRGVIRLTKSANPLMVNALDPPLRGERCYHTLGFAYTGRIPCTGARTCTMCGTRGPA